MKYPGQLIAAMFFMVLMISTVTFAQKAETFDIISYKVPVGWQKETGPNTVQFGTEGQDNACVITLFRSIAGTDSSTENFHYAWTSIVKDLVEVSADPQMQPPVKDNGWTSESGFASYGSDGKKGIVLLVTISGGGKMINILILTDTDVYQQPIDTFLESITLPDVPISKPPIVGQTSETNQISSRIWKSFQNRKDSMGSYAGYSTNTYEFNTNGTYKFSNVSFQLYAPKFSIVDEEGTYRINGSTITISPKKSNFHVHQSQKTDPAIKSGNLKLEAVNYSFEFTTIYDRWRLVLSPSNAVQTNRDGVFNYYANGQMTKSYLYDAQ